MRILHVDTGWEMRGGQYQVLLLLGALRQAGHQSILLARKGRPLAQAASAAGERVYELSAWRLLRMGSKFDLLHAHDARAHTLAALYWRGRFVVSRRVAFAIKRSVASRWKYRRAKRFLAVSNFVAGELVEAGVPRKRIDVVYDAVDERPMPSAERLQGNAVAIDSEDPMKGRDLTETASRLSGIPVRYSANLQEDLRCASMFVYITRSEGLGSAVLSAMKTGVPVIASRCGGLTEAIQDGKSGLLVANDPVEIAAAMLRIKADGQLASTLIDGGRKQVAERFSRRLLLQNTVRSYERALAS